MTAKDDQDRLYFGTGKIIVDGAECDCVRDFTFTRAAYPPRVRDPPAAPIGGFGKKLSTEIECTMKISEEQWRAMVVGMFPPPPLGFVRSFGTFLAAPQGEPTTPRDRSRDIHYILRRDTATAEGGLRYDAEWFEPVNALYQYLIDAAPAERARWAICFADDATTEEIVGRPGSLIIWTRTDELDPLVGGDGWSCYLMLKKGEAL